MKKLVVILAVLLAAGTAHADTITIGLFAPTAPFEGTGDRASHAFGGRRTARNEPMYAKGGVAYVYLCYGIHHLFNVVTGEEGNPHAVLIRAAVPAEGEKLMQRRRGKTKTDRTLMAGPGSVSQALGITTRLSGTSLHGERIWIEDAGIEPASIAAGPRIGAVVYNAFHSYVGPALLAAVCLLAGLSTAVPLIWAAHIGFDRALGYGLKYASGFSDTHLGVIGRRAGR